MPNYCASRLTITGPREARDALVKKFDHENEEDGYLTGMVRRGIVMHDFTHDDTKTEYVITTAWSPIPSDEIDNVMETEEFCGLTYEYYAAEKGVRMYMRAGTVGPHYECNFAAADFDPVDPDDEEEKEWLREPLRSHFQELYDMSG